MDTSKYICESAEDKLSKMEQSNETDVNESEKIEEIREWLKNMPEINPKTDDYHILHFLRVCKYDIENTKLRIRKYYELKAECSEWFNGRDPFTPESQEILNLGVLLPLKEVDEENRMIVIDRICVHDPARHTFEALFKVGTATVELAMRDYESLTREGVLVILDVKGASFGHVVQGTPSVVKQLIYSVQGCFPIKIKSIHVVNLPRYMTVLFNVFKKFFSKKMRERLIVSSDDNVLRETFPKELMPVEYGGTNGSINDLRDYWKEKVEKNREWIIDDEKYKLLKE